VVMTLGANPLLSCFTNINFPSLPGQDIIGRCVRSTGYYRGFPLVGRHTPPSCGRPTRSATT
jgi:hypothetical protein